MHLMILISNDIPQMEVCFIRNYSLGSKTAERFLEEDFSA